MQFAAKKNDKLLSQALAVCIGGYIFSSLFVTLEYETFYMLLGLARTSVNGKISKGLLHERDLKLIGMIAIVWIMIVYIGVIFIKSYFSEAATNSTVACAICDRLVHNGYRITLKGESMRKMKNKLT